MDDELTSVIAQLRRLYLHMVSGASITYQDLSRVIQRLEEINDGLHTDPN